jgi:hypothetical protein
MTRRTCVVAVLGGALILLGVPVWAAQRIPAGLPPSAALLLRYDANHDGTITREEMEAGLKADFDAADSDHDGCLSPAEVRAENERRLKVDGAQASPLVDWNLDGCVDRREFGNTVRSYFDLADRTKDGKVSQLELRGPSMPIAPPTVEKKTTAANNPPGGNGIGAGSSPATNPSRVPTPSNPSGTPY